MCQVVAWDGRYSWVAPKSGEMIPSNFNWKNSFTIIHVGGVLFEKWLLMRIKLYSFVNTFFQGLVRSVKVY